MLRAQEVIRAMRARIAITQPLREARWHMRRTQTVNMNNKRPKFIAAFDLKN